jgi:hypothetical protein
VIIVAQGAVFRSADPRFPQMRVFVAAFREREMALAGVKDDVIGVSLGRDGHEQKAVQARFVYPMSHFTHGDHWVPDDTGLPVRLAIDDDLNVVDLDVREARELDRLEAHAGVY